MTAAPVAAGQVFRTYRRTVTEADLVNFIGLAGLRLPIFLDEEHARTRSPYGGRIAPGFLVTALSAGMIESVMGARTLAGLSVDRMRFLAPTRIGDTLGAEITIEELRPTREGGRLVAVLGIRMLNQTGTAVMEYHSTVLLAAEDEPPAGA